MIPQGTSICPLCDGTDFELIARFNRPPKLEIALPGVDAKDYKRELIQCRRCKHMLSIHDMPLKGLYGADYVESRYQGDKLQKTFERVIALPPEQSDNYWRVRRIDAYVRPKLLQLGLPLNLLDIGSGLGVFPYGMKEQGWAVTALDPDPRQSAHIRDIVGVNAIHTDFMSTDDLSRHSLVTFNKVLEHVNDPVAMLYRARGVLTDNGFCYIELPDGEAAIFDPDGPDREEFTIEHPHVFSAASIVLLAVRAGFRIDFLERIRENSSKYTLYCFLTRSSI